MTTYSAIPNSDIDTDSPLDTDLMTKMRDNPIAITEGASGAPNIQTAAIANAAVTSAKLATGTNERDWVLARTAAASVGAVGTYAYLVLPYPGSGTVGEMAPGNTLAGSSLRYSGFLNSTLAIAGSAPSGTWRVMGRVQSTTSDDQSTLMLRVV